MDCGQRMRRNCNLWVMNEIAGMQRFKIQDLPIVTI